MPMIVAMPGEGDEALPPEEEAVALPPPAPPAEDVLPEKSSRDFKAEAVSVTHLMTHTPKNPYCAACQRSRCKGSLVGGKSGSKVCDPRSSGSR